MNSLTLASSADWTIACRVMAKSSFPLLLVLHWNRLHRSKFLVLLVTSIVYIPHPLCHPSREFHRTGQACSKREHTNSHTIPTLAPYLHATSLPLADTYSTTRKKATQKRNNSEGRTGGSLDFPQQAACVQAPLELMPTPFHCFLQLQAPRAMVHSQAPFFRFGLTQVQACMDPEIIVGSHQSTRLPAPPLSSSFVVPQLNRQMSGKPNTKSMLVSSHFLHRSSPG